MPKRKPDTPSSSSSSFSNRVLQKTAESLSNEQRSSKTARNGSEVSEQGRNSPVASTPRILPFEGVITFTEEEIPRVVHTNVNRGCSSSNNMTHSSAEGPEMSRVASASTEVQIKREVIANGEIEDSEEVVMDGSCSSSPSGQQSLPSVRRSKRVSTMVSKEIEKYFEGCLVMVLLEGFPVSSGMIRKPDEDSFNLTHVGSGQDEYICKENGVFYFYVQIFEEPTTLKWLTISNLELFDPALERSAWWDPDPTVIVNFKIGAKMAIAASKYSVRERLMKFTLRVGTSIENLLAEIENLSSQPTTPRPPPPLNNVTVQRGDEATATANGESSTVSVVRVKHLVIDIRRKLRDTEEANKSLKMENSKFRKKIDELEATVRELKQKLDSTSGTSTAVLMLEGNLKSKDKTIKAQEKVVIQLRAENLELQENLAKESEEKRGCQENLEKMRSEFRKLEELFEDGT